MKRRSVLRGVLVFLAVIGLQAGAQVSSQIHYQGRLISGTNLYNGPATLLFAFYPGEVGGTALYTEQDVDVPVVDGLYATFIGDNPLSGSLPLALTRDEVWLALTVNGTPMMPRERVGAVAYALIAAAVTNQAISSAMLGPAVVTQAKIATNSIVNVHLTDGVISNRNLAFGAVTSDKIGNGEVVPPDLDVGSFSNTFWTVGGNAGTRPPPLGADFAGTLDDRPFELRVHDARVARFFPDASSPLIILGHGSNSVTGTGGAIAGGGSDSLPQFLGDAYGFIGGGLGNTVSNGTAGVVAGGLRNHADAHFAAIGGGQQNLAQGPNSVTGGGSNNTARSSGSVVAGGGSNLALGAYGAVGGGQGNLSGAFAVVPGGRDNQASGDYSFAGGGGARASHPGAFVWADQQDGVFGSAASNQFLVRAGRGFGLNTTNLKGDIHFASGRTGQIATLVVSPAATNANEDGAQILLAEDRGAIYGMYLQYEVDSEQLQILEKDSVLTNGPRLAVSRRNNRVGVGTTNLMSALTVNGHILPDGSNLFALGSASYPWQKLYLASQIHYASPLGFVNGTRTGLVVDAAGSLAVQGSVTITGEYRYAYTRTNYLWIPPQEFVPQHTDHNYRYSSGYLYLTGTPKSASFAAGVHLPQDAEIAAVSSYCRNLGSYAMTCEVALARHEYEVSGIQYIAWLQQVAASSPGSDAEIETDTAMMSPYDIVDNENTRYWVEVELSVGTFDGVNQQFHGVRVEYRTDALRY
ncbi:MAG TPA: hypothetical protein P5567_00410 [Kiritimatiellia bacterium]|nr:hypothetical protein [Kiritimatiellia bacterium]HRZ10896.1 hypothetical protein [Kiritimatiellia bacterium]HSA18831.1 hypothetical protein [Kiritimatiellia bacterium]